MIAVQAVAYVADALCSLPVIQMAFARDAEVARVLAVVCLDIMPLGYGVQGCIILIHNSSLNALHRPMQAHQFKSRSLVCDGSCHCLPGLGNHLAGLPGLFAGGVIANMLTAVIAYRWFYAFNQRKPCVGELPPAALAKAAKAQESSHGA